MYKVNHPSMSYHPAVCHILNVLELDPKIHLKLYNIFQKILNTNSKLKVQSLNLPVPILKYNLLHIRTHNM